MREAREVVGVPLKGSWWDTSGLRDGRLPSRPAGQSKALFPLHVNLPSLCLSFLLRLEKSNTHFTGGLWKSHMSAYRSTSVPSGE